MYSIIHFYSFYFSLRFIVTFTSSYYITENITNTSLNNDILYTLDMKINIFDDYTSITLLGVSKSNLIYALTNLLNNQILSHSFIMLNFSQNLINDFLKYWHIKSPIKNQCQHTSNYKHHIQIYII